MKLVKNTFSRILTTSVALAITSVASAQEEIAVEPEIAICEMMPTIEFINTEFVEEEVAVEEIVTIEEEIAIEEEVSEELEIIEEILQPYERELVDCEGLKEEPKIIICWEPEWLYRNNVEGEFNIALQSVGTPSMLGDGSITENVAFQSSAPIVGVASNAPQAADEASAVTSVRKSSVSTNISRVASKPTAVKSNGRVFLR